MFAFGRSVCVFAFGRSVCVFAFGRSVCVFAFGRSVCLAFFCRSIKCSGLAVRLDPHPLPTPTLHSPQGHSHHSSHPHHRSTTTLDMRHQKVVSLGVLGFVSQVLKEAPLFCVCVCMNWTLPSVRGRALLFFPLLAQQGGLSHFLAAAKLPVEGVGCK